MNDEKSIGTPALNEIIICTMWRYGKILSIVVVVWTAGSPAFADQRLKSRGLTRKEASDRALIVSNVRYRLQLTLAGGGGEFRGRAEVLFLLRTPPSDPLFLDFKGGVVEEIRLNGVSADRRNYDGDRIKLQGPLVGGENRIEILYRHPYGTSGDGLYRVKDAEDGNSYIYSNFEPFSANEVFPCFDQPDLKASFQIRVVVPTNWTVVSAVRESGIKTVGPEREWEFPETPRFSTYLMSFHAGPYVVWESKAGKTPLRLFARKSLARYVDAAEWLNITRQGFAFYEKYFDQPYPFPKYDQIIVPDFNWSGMENVGAVAFSERMISKGRASRMQRLGTAELILHELAHLWFGDLVTMKWWDDLWLNESFASYLSHVALEEGTEFKEAPVYFHWRMKRWAYGDDRLPTTHPIRSEVPDTESAFAVFDGITYGKGASALKQLAFFVEPLKFRDGVRIYLKRHAFSNAELADFVRAVEESSGKSLSSWTLEWLRTAGLTSLRSSFECEGSQLKSITVEQGRLSGANPIKRHRTILSLLGPDKAGRYHNLQTLPVFYDGSTTRIEAKGVCPQFLFPNAGDHDFAKVELDPISLSNIDAVLTTKEDSLLRSNVWLSYWDRVRDGRESVIRFIESALKALEVEEEPVLVSGVLETIAGSGFRSAYALGMLPAGSGTGSNPAETLTLRFENLAQRKLHAAAPGGDLQAVWFSAFVRSARSLNAQKQLVSLLTGRTMLKGFPIDQDRRWQILIALNAGNAQDAVPLTDAEARRDPSDEGRKMAAACALVRPDRAVKKTFLQKVRNAEIPDALAKRLLPYLFPVSQRDLHSELESEIFKDLAAMASTRDSNLMKIYSIWAIPAVCTAGSASRIAQFESDHRDLPDIVRKNLIFVAYEDAMCADVRAKARP